MLFYLAAPYWGQEKDYGKEMFNRADFEALAGFMGSVKGKMLMSINDVEGVRTLFKDYSIE